MTSHPRNDDEMAGGVPAGDKLVVRAKGDREAFGALYDRFLPVVHRYCRRRLLNEAAADDVASDVFLQVARAIHRFPGTTEEDFRRWIYRIATNAINAYRRQAARRGTIFDRARRLGWSSESEPVSPSCDDEFENVLAGIAMLGEREQAAITLRFMEGLSYEDVGKILDTRPATVRVVVSRALQSLRQWLAARSSRAAAARSKGQNP
jgi:RNA polymerase sigma-70 factor (ECF subfamily)